jgi:hypothetical protein
MKFAATGRCRRVWKIKASLVQLTAHPIPLVGFTISKIIPTFNPRMFLSVLIIFVMILLPLFILFAYLHYSLVKGTESVLPPVGIHIQMSQLISFLS